MHPVAAVGRLSLVPGVSQVSATDGAQAAATPLRPVDGSQAAAGGRYGLGDRTCRAYIVLGIGNDDTIDTVVESEHDTQQQARVWIERILPRTAFPDWVAARRHGTAGAYLYGGVLWGRYILDLPDDDRGVQGRGA